MRYRKSPRHRYIDDEDDVMHNHNIELYTYYKAKRKILDHPSTTTICNYVNADYNQSFSVDCRMLPLARKQSLLL